MKEDITKNKSFTLPKNIRQIGGIDCSYKIYVEDYVFTFLQTYSKNAKSQERIAVLIGNSYTIDSKKVLFINGAIKGDYAVREDGILKFSTKSIDYIENQIDKYFSSSKIIGWYYSQPGFLDYINDGYLNYHREFFEEDTDKVFFLTDPIENIENFYIYNNNKFKLVDGFIIYYEKNDSMNEYMLENKVVEINLEEKKYRDKDERITRLARGKSILKEDMNFKKDKIKLSNLFSTTSAILLLLCTLLGVKIFQSNFEIKSLRTQILKLDESYRYALSEIKNSNVKSVFAQDDTISHKSKSSKDNDKTYNSNDDINTISNTPTTIIKDNIKKGVPVNLPKQETKSTNTFKTYLVKSGDTLEAISMNFYGNRHKVEDIMKANNIYNSDTIYIGMSLKIPR